jgi:molecular chaperone GrpE (heat shock protein)
MKLPSGINTFLKRLRNDSASKDSELLSLRDELDKLRAQRDQSQQTSVASDYSQLFQESSSPISQLLLQLHLAEMPDNTLTASDVLVHIKKVLTIFQQHGMTVLGHAGDIVAFDPNLHELASPTCHIEKNTAVCVRFPGIGHRSTVIRKAVVGIEENH